MNVGILDCKVGSYFLEDVARYKERGYDVINAGALDRPSKRYDVLAATWTRLSAKRLANVGCHAVVVKDNDEPFNVIQQKTIDALNMRVQLIDNWGISTRVAWNLSQIERYAPQLDSLLMIAATPSHDAIAKRFFASGVFLDYRKASEIQDRQREAYDAVIVHLSKDDFAQHWFDQFLKKRIAHDLLISTTRGPLMSAKALNVAVQNRTPETAVLDWCWQERQLDTQLIADKRIVLTQHTSYRSADAQRELTDVTIAAVERTLAGMS
jgi:hypothetical protein